MQKRKRIYQILLIVGITLLLLDPIKSLIHRRHTNFSQKNLETNFNPGFTTPDENGIVWQDDFETGDLSQWPSYSGEQTSFDSGECIRPKNGVSTDFSFSGNYALKMSIDSTSKKSNIFQQKDSGCRQFRFKEMNELDEVYLTAWYYLPKKYVVTPPGWAMFGQIKSKRDQGQGQSDPIWAWKIETSNDDNLYLHLNFKAAMDGPFVDSEYIYHKANDGEFNHHEFYQDTIPIPINEWFNLQVYVKQSETYEGQIIVWQDDVEIFNLENIKTKYPGSSSNWSVTSYGGNIIPNIFTVYVDDVSISTKKVTVNKK